MNKKRSTGGGIVYSTNPSFTYHDSMSAVPETPPGKQELKVWLDSKQRKGKSVTLITGFECNNDRLKELEKSLKVLCGTGGSSRNGEILLQGDFREKVIAWLISKGYKVKRAGG